jgi:ribA/ribD-fused uncharacterized protein
MEIMVDGKSFVYTSLEQAFQHKKAKTLRDQRTAVKIMQSRNAAAAKNEGDLLNRHPNIGTWKKIEDKIMQDLLLKKYHVSRAFREKLTRTGSAQILHSVDHMKWGIALRTTEVCHPIDPSLIKGQNVTGRLLMSLREAMSRGTTCASTESTITRNNNNSLSQASEPSPNMTSTTSSSRPNTTPRVDLVGSSLLKGVDESRLSRSLDIHKTISYTISESSRLDLAALNSDLIVYQLTTNDLKLRNPDQVINEMKALITKTQTTLPKCKVVISLAPLQSPRNNINQKIKVVNATLELIFKDSNIITCVNDNITPYNGCLATDGVHLNHRGSSMLASNLRGVILESMPYSSKQITRYH